MNMTDRTTLETMRTERQHMLASVSGDISNRLRDILKKKIQYEYEKLAELITADEESATKQLLEKKVLSTHYFVEKKLSLDLI